VTLKDQIKHDLAQAMKARATHEVDTLRLLRAAIQRREVDDRVELDDTGVTGVIEKLIKQGRESITQFDQAGRTELADKERAEIAVYQRYLPEALGEAEIAALIDAALAETGASSVRDMGKVMGVLKPKLAGRADMGAVSALVRARLGA